MAEFLVETYIARADDAAAERGAERARDAAEQLTREGRPVRFLRTIFVPEDETCFYLFEAGSATVVREASRRAAVQFERVVEAASRRQRSGDEHAR
jgi:Protein of unknown function (DUF4242)